MAWLRVGDPRGRTRVEPLDGDRAVVGRSNSCEIRIDDPEVALRHVSILKTERGYLLVNEAESLPVLRAGEAVNNHFMVPEVPYRIGASTLVLVVTDVPHRQDIEDEGPSQVAVLGTAPTVMGEPLVHGAAARPGARPTLLGGDSETPNQDPPAKRAPPAARSDQTKEPPWLPRAALQADKKTQLPTRDEPPPSATATVAGSPLPGPARSGATELDSTAPHVQTPPPPKVHHARHPAATPPPGDGAPPWARGTPPPRTNTSASSSRATPPVRFKADADAASPGEPPPSDKTDGSTGPRAPDSWTWPRQHDGQPGSSPSVYSMGDGSPGDDAPGVQASSRSWNWHEPKIDLPPQAPAPPSPTPAPPATDTVGQPPPAAELERSGVRPVLLRTSETPEPPLPAVSKELSSGHSWLWALPSSVRDGSEPGTILGERDRALILAGIVLMILGALLVAISFALGLSPAIVVEWIGGGS